MDTPDFSHVTLLIYFTWRLTDWHHDGWILCWYSWLPIKIYFVMQDDPRWNILNMFIDPDLIHWHSREFVHNLHCTALNPGGGWFPNTSPELDAVSVTEMIWLPSSQSGCNLHIDSKSWVIQISLDNSRHGLVSEVMCKWEKICFPWHFFQPVYKNQGRK